MPFFPPLPQTTVAQAASSSYPTQTRSPGMCWAPCFSVLANLSQIILLDREQIARLPTYMQISCLQIFLTALFHLLKRQHVLFTNWAIPLQPLHNFMVWTWNHHIEKEMVFHMNAGTFTLNCANTRLPFVFMGVRWDSWQLLGVYSVVCKEWGL